MICSIDMFVESKYYICSITSSYKDTIFHSYPLQLFLVRELVWQAITYQMKILLLVGFRKLLRHAKAWLAETNNEQNVCVSNSKNKWNCCNTYLVVVIDQKCNEFVTMAMLRFCDASTSFIIYMHSFKIMPFPRNFGKSIILQIEKYKVDTVYHFFFFKCWIKF